MRVYINLFVEGNTNEAEKAIINGVIALSDFEVTDTTDQRVVGFDSFSVQLDTIDNYIANFQLGTVALDGS